MTIAVPAHIQKLLNEKPIQNYASGVAEHVAEQVRNQAAGRQAWIELQAKTPSKYNISSMKG